jgi:hypothetical protein
LRLIDETLDVSFPVEELKRLVRRKHVWVAGIGARDVVGMVIVSEREGAAYIEEMDVLPAARVVRTCTFERFIEASRRRAS